MVYIWALKIALGYSINLHQPETEQEECVFILKCMFQHVLLDIPPRVSPGHGVQVRPLVIYTPPSPQESWICFFKEK